MLKKARDAQMPTAIPTRIPALVNPNSSRWEGFIFVVVRNVKLHWPGAAATDVATETKLNRLLRSSAAKSWAAQDSMLQPPLASDI